MSAQPHEFVHLTDRMPNVSVEELLAGFAPSPRFHDVSFDSYIPDPNQPSQSDTAASCISVSITYRI